MVCYTAKLEGCPVRVEVSLECGEPGIVTEVLDPRCNWSVGDIVIGDSDGGMIHVGSQTSLFDGNKFVCVRRLHPGERVVIERKGA